MKPERITVTTTVKASPEKTWEYWTTPEHIIRWNSASSDWHTPRAENDLRENGRFSFRMEARDGSTGFDFGGTYTRVKPYQNISYTMDDGRKVEVRFSPQEEGTLIEEEFEAEDTFPPQYQREGWQAILNKFKEHLESAL